MTTSDLTDLLHTLEASRDEMVSVLQSLVRCPSETGLELECSRLIAAILDEWDIPSAPHESQPGRPNIVSVLPGSGEGRNFLLCGGHFDHMPPGDISKWDFPPYAGDYVDGWVRGRGSANGKSQVAAAMLALKVLVQSGIPIRGDIVSCFVVDEEAMGTHGAHYLLENGLVYGDWGMVGLPGRLDAVVIGCKGPLWMTVEVQGESGHGPSGEFGSNAIEKAAALVQAIGQIELTKRHPAWEGPRLGIGGDAVGSITVNMINGGTHTNLTPESCHIRVDRRLMPNETVEEAIGEIEAVFEDLSSRDPTFLARIIEISHARIGHVLAEDEPIITLAQQATGFALGKPTLHRLCAPGSGDSLSFVAAGIPVVTYGGGLFGPDGNVAFYRPNEQVSVDEVVAMAKVYLSALVFGTDTLQAADSSAPDPPRAGNS